MPNDVVDVWKTGDHKSPLLTSNAASAAKLAVNHCGGNEIYNHRLSQIGAGALQSRLPRAETVAGEVQ
jgi:hypothetical protein